MRLIFIILIFCLTGFSLPAQVLMNSEKDSLHGRIVVNGDTLRFITLHEARVYPSKPYKSRSQERQYSRLVYNIKKVLPYSKVVAATVNEVELRLSMIKSEKERKVFIKNMEDSLWKLYEPDMRQMTITQGELLFKLVDRETSNSTYFWIESFRGSFSAFFWQGVARLFGTNLKSRYDPKGEDAIIEQIVNYIEKGYL